MGYFGFEGDKQLGVDLLKQPGGWGQTPPIPRDLQGLRRPLADMTLLAYILYISTLVPTGRIDTALAARVLEFNQDLYSNGSFFLLFQGRLKTIQTLEEEAVKYYWKSINSQQEAVQLHHICASCYSSIPPTMCTDISNMQHWDLGIIYMAMGDMSAAHSSFSIIYQSSNWSKAVYAYAAAASLYDEAVQSNPIDSTKREQAAKLMREVPGHKKRIAGKSIPMEVGQSTHSLFKTSSMLND